MVYKFWMLIVKHIELLFVTYYTFESDSNTFTKLLYCIISKYMGFYQINSILLAFGALLTSSNVNSKEIDITQIDSTARVLYVNNNKSNITIPKDSIFETKYSVIPLQTTVESLIGQIGRISIHNDNFYILDKERNSVLIFDSFGKFKKKVAHLGSGPGEYTSLADFSIDSKNNNIILYCDRPKKLIIYSVEDKFQSEIPIEPLFESITFDAKNGILTGINRMPFFKNYFITYDLYKKAKGKSFIPITSNKIEVKLSNYKSEFPFWIKSRHDYCIIPTINTIHKIDNDSLTKSFNLQFKNTIAKGDGEEKSANEIITSALTDNLGFWYSNFREYDHLLTYSFGRGTKVFYQKNNDNYIMFDHLENKEYFYSHDYHFAHDYYGKANEDNSYIFVEKPTKLLEYYNSLKTYSSSDWNKIDKQIKEKIAKIKVDDNPILYIYKIKN